MSFPLLTRTLATSAAMLPAFVAQPSHAQCSPSWSDLNITGPSPRSGAALAYDAARSVVVLVGGRDTSGACLNDCWEFNGTTWTARGIATTQLAGEYAVGWYDGLNARTAFFGGRCNLAGTFPVAYFNGTSWSSAFGAGTPGPRFGAAVATDYSRNITFYTGGNSGSGPGFTDTWSWSGGTWTSRVTSGIGSRYGHGMAWDAARSKLVLYGGADNNTFTLLANAPATGTIGWSFGPFSGPPARRWTTMAYNPADQKVVLYGGIAADGCTTCANHTDTWTWNGASWTQLQASHPSGGQGAAMVYHAASGKLIRFGGLKDDGTPDGRTWVLAQCRADFDCSGSLSVQDIFDFLAAWFAASPTADFNGGGLSVQDIFDFLAAWFAGCP